MPKTTRTKESKLDNPDSKTNQSKTNKPNSKDKTLTNKKDKKDKGKLKQETHQQQVECLGVVSKGLRALQ